MLLYAIVAALVVMLASLAGIVFVSGSLSRVVGRNLKILIAFAAGVFATLTYSLFAETLLGGLSISSLLLSALGGALFLEMVGHLIPRAHHHHGTRHGHAHGRPEAHRMLFGDAVHNIGDGIILVPAFLADVWIGIGTALGIFFHELVQEIAEFFVLTEAGYTAKQALARNFAASATILLGVILAFSVATVEQFELPLLAFAGGGLLYVILRDLLPSILRSIRTEGQAAHFVVAALVGAAILLGVQTLTG
jgi:zinc and cadmium transporter